MIFNNKLLAFRSFIIPMLSIFLSGCAGMSSKFDCNPDAGGRGAPMHHINQMANYGAFSEAPALAVQHVPAALQALAAHHAPVRSNKKVHQIWIAPYEDSSGNYHEATHVYAAIKNHSS